MSGMINSGVSSFKGKAYHMPSFGSGESKVLSAGGYDSEKEELYLWLHAFEESEKSFHSFTLFCEHKVTVDIPPIPSYLALKPLSLQLKTANTFLNTVPSS
jgi:hypothetical protein